ncbi:tripartite tricarboxylate transporter substrate binding protein [Acidovorax sp. ACV01]|uniref:Bug family tripartite tricarboxylate transporter substrate binding protein n=1 Tax=Acidovorax sp. ACV01 TaxID=2769311 RepID=UPI001780B24E|nr:tripartite tricarboxylate transporter substrate binding protein [Acidovorax sp. ACV01]MBD9394161.1 tripartite tricarboxylate transporter substrate binding protein [Acidovorax sp. ACV01]
MNRFLALGAAVLGGILLGAPSPSLAESTFPSKPIKVIVPFPPGGGGDTLARLVLTRAGRELGQPIVFENLSGAGGNVGSQSAVSATADGYALLYGTNGTFGINHTLYKKPGFDPVRDFSPVGQLTRIAAMVVVRPGLPAQTLPELLRLIKASPGKYTFASAGNGTTSHLAGEILKARTGIDMVHVPYRGGAPAMTDLMGGQVDLMIDVMPNTASQVRGGRVRGLAVTTVTRVSQMPDVPTIAESGVEGFDVSAWDGIFVPAGTPAPVIEKLNAAIHKALADPEVRKSLADRGAEAAPSTPQALARLVHASIQSWGAAVKRSGATVD